MKVNCVLEDDVVSIKPSKSRLKLKFERLDYQQQAVDSVCNVFKDVSFRAPIFAGANPLFDVQNRVVEIQLKKNIEQVREANQVVEGNVTVTENLTIDVLMETGTGKTFTFIESIYRLHEQYGLSKFLILVPSNAIRQGTLKNLEVTKEFFQKAYGKSLSVFSYSDKTVFNFVNAPSENISVMVSTYQSFNKESNTIHKKAVEQSLIGRATSYIEAISALRPVIIIDEPHRFEGQKTAANLSKFNPLFTLRFGATFKNDVYKNLIFTLDSITAFKKGLVKSITVDTIGNENIEAHSLALEKVTGIGQKNYVAKVHYKDIASKNKKVDLIKGANLGELTSIDYLSGYVVEKITKKEVIFTNGFALPIGLDNASSYGVLLDGVQTEIIKQTIDTHFEREEALFIQGIKSLTLFFIDSVGKYLLDNGNVGVLAKKFEDLYRKKLVSVLKNSSLDKEYRAYLERTVDNVSAVHQGYFAKSNKDKDLEDMVDLILERKEDLLSTDTDLRFIFSMWALQEGWDNPNIFTLCKLAPSNSKITKLQQIGRGLRLAVNQEGERITSDHDSFDFVNELNVIVPSTEGNFVESIQNEIAANSLSIRALNFEQKLFIELGIVTTDRQAGGLMDVMEELEIVEVDEADVAKVIASKECYEQRRASLLEKISTSKKVKEINLINLERFFKDFYLTESKVRNKSKIRKAVKLIKIKTEHYQQFKVLWENLNRDAELKYDLVSDDFIQVAVNAIENSFDIKQIQVKTTRHKAVENAVQENLRTDYKAITYHSVFNLFEFVKALSNATQLSFKTITVILKGMSKPKFDMIGFNENQALMSLKAIILQELYALIVNKISYDVKEIRAKATSLTRADGIVKDYINAGACGRERYDITGKVQVLDKSLYDETYIEIDSEIEGKTVDESTANSITVFAKLPKINIPVPNGRYNPDFGYVIDNEGQKTLYLVVETKGYDHELNIPPSEKIKIDSAKVFFEKLQSEGVDIHFKTKINNQALVDILGEIERGGLNA